MDRGSRGFRGTSITLFVYMIILDCRLGIVWGSAAVRLGVLGSLGDLGSSLASICRQLP